MSTESTKSTKVLNVHQVHGVDQVEQNIQHQKATGFVNQVNLLGAPNNELAYKSSPPDIKRKTKNM